MQDLYFRSYAAFVRVSAPPRPFATGIRPTRANLSAAPQWESLPTLDALAVTQIARDGAVRHTGPRSVQESSRAGSPLAAQHCCAASLSISGTRLPSVLLKDLENRVRR